MSAPAIKPAIVVTAADLAPQAVSVLKDFELVYAGKTPDEEGLVPSDCWSAWRRRVSKRSC